MSCGDSSGLAIYSSLQSWADEPSTGRRKEPDLKQTTARRQKACSGSAQKPSSKQTGNPRVHGKREKGEKLLVNHREKRLCKETEEKAPSCMRDEGSLRLSLNSGREAKGPHTKGGTTARGYCYSGVRFIRGGKGEETKKSKDWARKSAQKKRASKWWPGPKSSRSRRALSKGGVHGSKGPSSQDPLIFYERERQEGDPRRSTPKRHLGVPAPSGHPLSREGRN